MDLTYVSFGVCLCNTLFVMPFDFVKTKYQKFNSSNLSTPLSTFIRDVLKKDGIRVFYRGSLVKIVQYNINAFFTVQLFERLLKSYKEWFINKRNSIFFLEAFILNHSAFSLTVPSAITPSDSLTILIALLILLSFDWSRDVSLRSSVFLRR